MAQGKSELRRVWHQTLSERKRYRDELRRIRDMLVELGPEQATASIDVKTWVAYLTELVGPEH